MMIVTAVQKGRTESNISAIMIMNIATAIRNEMFVEIVPNLPRTNDMPRSIRKHNALNMEKLIKIGIRHETIDHMSIMQIRAANLSVETIMVITITTQSKRT